MAHEDLVSSGGLTDACLIIRFAVGTGEARDPEWREHLSREAATFVLGHAATGGIAVDFYVDPFASSGVELADDLISGAAEEFQPGEEDFNPLLDRNPNLDLPLSEVLAPVKGDDSAARESTRIINAIQISGPHTVRDLCGIGQVGIVKVGGIKEGSIPFFGAKLAALNDPHLRWERKPGIDDWIRLYDYATEIPAIVIGYEFDTRVKLGTVISMTERQLAEELYYQEVYKRDRIRRSELPPAVPQEGHYRKARLLLRRASNVVAQFSTRSETLRSRL